MLAIETDALRREFRSRRGTVTAVAGVDLRVPAGLLYGFLGPNGAGKTTTLRLLATLLRPTGGRAQVAGHDLLAHPERVRAQIGYVSQTGGADHRATARENLVLQGRLFAFDRARAERRAAELIAALDLASFADRPVSGYSGGQRRRLDIALGMVHAPTLLFLDEPTTGLDPQSRARLWDEIRALNRQGTTVFLTTHYLEEADQLCDRVAIIDGGRIVAEGTPDDLKREIAGDQVTFGLDADEAAVSAAAQALAAVPGVRESHAHGAELRLYVEHGESALPALLRAVDASGAKLRTVNLARPSLDDVFLRQTGRSLRDDATP